MINCNQIAFDWSTRSGQGRDDLKTEYFIEKLKISTPITFMVSQHYIHF